MQVDSFLLFSYEGLWFKDNFSLYRGSFSYEEAAFLGLFEKIKCI